APAPPRRRVLLVPDLPRGHTSAPPFREPSQKRRVVLGIGRGNMRVAGARLPAGRVDHVDDHFAARRQRGEELFVFRLPVRGKNTAARLKIGPGGELTDPVGTEFPDVGDLDGVRFAHVYAGFGGLRDRWSRAGAYQQR